MTREEKNAYQREWNRKNRDKKRLLDQKYRAEHKEEIKEIHRKWREKNRDHINELNRKKYKENPQAFAERNKKYIETHQEKVQERMKKYRETHKKEKYEYEMKRRSNPLNRLKLNIRSLIKNSIEGKHYKKNTKTEKILGCTLDFFIEYLQSKFEEGMTIENHGLWHIDHIKPIALATTEEEIIKLNHYTNLQPLWAIDNLKKGSKYIEGSEI